MRYDEIQPTPARFRLPTSHPVLAQVEIDPADWYDFQRLDADNPATHVLDHQMTDGRMTVFVACASDEVRQRLEDGWA
jgi:hypothetical protein